jgi:flagella basal body P-ring formation protein FlgA
VPARSLTRRIGRLLLPLGLAALVPGAAPASAGDPGRALGAWIEEFVRLRAPEGARVEVPSLEGFAPAGLPPDTRVELGVHPGQAFDGLVPVTVALQVGDEVVRRGVVTVEVHTGEREVVVAARPLRAGRAIRPGDLARAPFDAAELPPAWTADPAPLLGRRLAQGVSAGTPLRTDQLQEAPTVQRGEKVRLRLARGALVIETLGQAREDGREGEWIRVTNAASRREVLGRVGADGVIHVDY